MSYSPPPGPPGPYGAGPPPQHPRAVLILVFGIIGVVICGPLAVAALIMGNTARQEIQQRPGAYSGEGMVTAGWVLGIIGTVLWALGILFLAIG